METRASILIVDDEAAIRKLLQISLESNGYAVLEASTGAAALIEAATRAPKLILLDLSLPDMEGVDVLKRIREWSKIPLIVLTVRDAESSKVALLDAGADDYLTKPFSVPELLARVRVALRHADTDPMPAQFNNGPLTIDFAEHRVAVNGTPVKLTSTEFAILGQLARHVGKLVSQRQLLVETWGPSAVENTHYLRVYMAQLRQKLERDPSRPTLLITEPGIGYRMMIIEQSG